MDIHTWKTLTFLNMQKMCAEVDAHNKKMNNVHPAFSSNHQRILTHAQRITTHWQKFFIFVCAGKCDGMCDWAFTERHKNALSETYCYSVTERHKDALPETCLDMFDNCIEVSITIIFIFDSNFSSYYSFVNISWLSSYD